jgi:hypothetical protein
MTLKTIASRVGNGILDAGTAMHNASLDSDIDKIDEEIAALHAQLARLEERRSELEDRKI